MSAAMRILLGIICLIAICFGNPVDNQHIATSRGGPSALVDGCVSVITGDYYVNECDYVAGGFNPIRIPRTYFSSQMNHCTGWGVQPHLKATKIGNLYFVAEPDGTFLTYSATADMHLYTLHSTSYEKALTNLCQGQISARNDPKNNHLICNESGFTLHGANGHKRKYHLTNFANCQGQYVLDWERYSDGTICHYKWDPDKGSFADHDGLKKIEIRDPTNTVIYSSAKILYHDRRSNHPQAKYYLSDGKEVRYRYSRIKDSHVIKRLKNKGIDQPCYLKSIESPDFGMEKVHYLQKPHQNPSVTGRTRNAKCPIEVEYYKKGTFTLDHLEPSYQPADSDTCQRLEREVEQNPTNSRAQSRYNFVCTPHPVVIKVDKKSPTRGRVKCLKQPTGEGGALETSKTFAYHYRGKNTQGSQAHSWTNVYDCYSHLTTYRYNKDLRLYQIEKMDNDFKRYAYEHTTWIGMRFKAKTLLDPLFQPIHGYIYDYDKSGNVKCEKLWGQLTGESALNLQMHSPLKIEAIPNENTGELAKTHRTFTAANLLKTETNPSGLTIEYRYFKDTDLISAKYYLDGQTILKRQFLVYDDHHVLIQEIEDNGSSYKKSDLTNVTVRRIKAITPDYSGNYPGLPRLIKEGYQDNHQIVWLKKERYTYNASGLLESKQIIDSENNPRYTLHYTYDERSRLVFETNPIGQTASYRYDESNNCIYEQEFEGTETFYTFDACNRCTTKKIKAKDAKPRLYRYLYNRRHELIVETDPFGNKTKYGYDPLGRCHEKILPSDQSGKRPHERYAFDTAGNKILTIDPNGNKTHITHNAYRKPLQTTYPDGAIEKCTYYLFGNLKTKTAPNGTQTHYTYDVLDRPLTKTTLSSSGKALTQETYTYTAFNLIQKTNPEGNITTYHYDSAGRKIAEIQNQEKTTYEYDPLGHLHKTIHHADNNTLIEIKEHDNLGRIIEERTEDLNGTVFTKIFYALDAAGNRVQTWRFVGLNHEKAIEKCTYDGFNRLLSKTDPLGNTTTIAYLEKDNHLTKTTTNPKGLKTIEIYDRLNRLIESRLESDKELNKEVFLYDLNGNKLTQTSTVYSPTKSRSTTTQWIYDSKNRPLQITEAANTIDEKTTHITYTSTGKKATVTKPDKVTLTHEYDSLDRLKHLFSSDNSIDYIYTYNKLSQVIAVEDTIQNTQTKRTWDPKGRLLYERLGNGLELSNEYDALGRRTRLKLSNGCVKYIYNPAHLTSVNRYDSSGQLLYTHHYNRHDLSENILTESLIYNLGKTEYVYNKNSIPTSYKTPFYNHKITELDPNGNVLAAIQNTTSESYSYNILDQLTYEQNTFTHTYDYDSHHNRLLHNDKTYQINALNQLNEITYDANGNPIQVGDKLCKYDALDRLIQVTQQGITHNYTYDYLHRRIISNQTKHYLYDDKNEIGCTNENLKITQLRLLGLGQGAEIGASIAIEIHNNVYAPLHDLYGNIKALLDKEGNVCESYNYDSFGQHNLAQATWAGDYLPQSDTINNPWRYQSKRLDPTDFVYFGRRYYMPELGRFLTPDPLGLSEGPNLYQYLHNSPLLNYDEYGLAMLFREYSSLATHSMLRSFSDQFSQGTQFYDEFAGFSRVVAPWRVGLENQWISTNSTERFHEKVNTWHTKIDNLFSTNYAGSFDSSYASDFSVPITMGILPSPGGLINKSSKIVNNVASKTKPPVRPASSAVSGQLLKNRLIAEEIAGGHAFGKHVMLKQEFPKITTRAGFAKFLESILNKPCKLKFLQRGRSAYYHSSSNTIILRDPKSLDGGTAFKPDMGIRYFLKLEEELM